MAFMTTALVGVIAGSVGTLIYRQPMRLVDLYRETISKVWEDLPEESVETILEESVSFRKKTSMEVIRRNLTVSLTSAGLALAGKVVYPPLAFLSIPGIIYGMQPLYKNASRLLRAGQIGLDLLLLFTLGGCVLYGKFFLACLATVIAYLSRLLLLKITETTKGDLLDIFTHLPQTVWVRLADGNEIAMSAQDIKGGDLLVIHAGETIPADGKVVEGIASVDQHILTGEAAPVDRGEGEEVFALTTVLSGKIVVEVERAGEETAAANIAKILNQTVEFKSTIELRSERLAERTAAPMLAVSALSIPFLGLYGGLALLTTHFRYKVALITPISLLNFFRSASEHGILVKDGRSLDLLMQVDTIVFDKTGTLTEEQPTLGKIHTSGDYSEDDVLRFTAAAESWQTHPIARAIRQAAETREMMLPDIDDADYHIGYGLSVNVEGRRLQVGSTRFMELNRVAIPPNLQEVQSTCHMQGHSLVMVAIDSQMAGAIELLPSVRPEARAVIQRLRQNHNIKKIVLISGDHQLPTQVLAEDLGIDQWYAQTLPEQKAQKIEELKEMGHCVCYVGDGINDAIAMKTSHVSVSLGGASTLAMDTAQIILLDGGLTHLDAVFEFAQDFYTNTNVTFGLQLGTTIITAGGVVLFGFGLPAVMLLGWIGLGAGFVNAMMPLIKSASQQSLVIGE